MAAGTTIYDVGINYRLRDRASSGMRRLSRGAKRTGRSFRRLSNDFRLMNTTLRVFGMVKATQAFFGTINTHLIEYNANLETATSSMATLISMNTKTGPEQSWKLAGDLVKQFRMDSMASLGTTQDFVKMAGDLTGPITAAGGSMKDLRELTKGAVVAAQAFGFEPGVAARDFEAVLLGNVRQVDRLTKRLMAPTGKSFDEINSMDQAGRMQLLKDMLKSKELVHLSNKIENSFTGQKSSFIENLQRYLGEAGEPLMATMLAHLKKFNLWAKENGQLLSNMARTVGVKLKNAFLALKEVFQWLWEHKDGLISLAQAWAAIQVGKMVGGSGIAQGIGSLVGGAMSKTAAGAAGKSLLGMPARTALGMMAGSSGAAIKAGFMAAAGSVVMPVALSAASIIALGKYLNDKEDEKQDRIMTHIGTTALGEARELNSLNFNLERSFAMTKTRQEASEGRQSVVALKILRDLRVGKMLSYTNASGGIMPNMGPGVEGFRVNTRMLNKSLKESILNKRQQKEYKRAVESITSNPSLMASLAAAMLTQKARDAKGMEGAAEFDNNAKSSNMNGDVNIYLKTEDPDNFAMALSSSFEDFIKAPHQTQETLSRKLRQ